MYVRIFSHAYWKSPERTCLEWIEFQRSTNFTSRPLLYLYLCANWKMLYHLLFFTHVYSFFDFIQLKVSFMVSYFIKGLFKRESVWKITQLSIKKSKISNFSFTFKLNNNKKVPLKNFGLERRIENISQKKGSRGKEGEVLTRKGWRKNKGEDCDPQRNYGWDHYHRLCSEKGWIPSKVAVVQHLFLYQNYPVAASLLDVMAVANC